MEITPAVYSYIVTELIASEYPSLANPNPKPKIIAEIPFTSVSFNRNLSKAGTFSGTISLIKATEGLDLYNSTKPGKVALYILRKIGDQAAQCVWGGIIWSRSYNAIERTLQISASEFSSYFSHRFVWKTLTYGTEPLYIPSYSVSNGIATMTTESEHGYLPGDYVRVLDVLTTVNGYHPVAQVPSPTTFTFTTTASNTTGTTVYGTSRRVTDKYTLVRDLIEQVIVNDLYGIEFPNDILKPSKIEEVGISSFSRTSNVVTVKTSQPHGLTVGQEIDIQNVPTSSTPVSFKKIDNYSNYVSSVDITDGLATITTTTNHGYTTGDSVTFSEIKNINTLINEIVSQLNQNFSVTATPTTTTFRVQFQDTTLNTPTILGTYANLNLFQAANLTGTTAKDAYLVDNILYVWDTTNKEWDPYGIIAGGQTSINNITPYGVVTFGYGLATLTLTTAHSLVQNERIYVANVGEGFDGSHLVHDLPTSTTVRFKVYNVESLANTAVTPNGALMESDFDGLHVVTSIPRFSIIYASLTSNIVTLTTTQAHSFSTGQQVIISGINDTINGTYTIASTPTPNTFTYAKTADNVSTIELDPLGTAIASSFTFSNTGPNAGETATGGIVTKTVSTLAFSYPYVTVTTTTNHGLETGQRFKLSNFIDEFYLGDNEGRFFVAQKLSNTSFTYMLNNISASQPTIQAFNVGPGVEVSYGSLLYKATYGSYTQNTDIQINTGTELSGTYESYTVLRSDEDKNLLQRIDEIAETINGFEYRIDCSYDIDTASFTKTLVFVKNNFENAPANGVASSPSRFGADENVFEYPGNIVEFSIDESAEHASTRFFQVGNNSELSSEGLQPRAVATADDLLDNRWPLLDSMESGDTMNKETLYSKAQKNLYEDRPPYGEFSVTVNGSLDPTVGSYSPGDWCSLIIDDEFVKLRLASDDEIRKDIFVRKIAGYSVSVPDSPSYPERVTLELMTEWEADNLGDSKKNS